MRNDHTARLGGCARGEDDLHDVVTRERWRNNWLGGATGKLLAQSFQIDLCDARDVVLHRVNTEPGVHLFCDTLGEIGSRNLIDRHNDSAAQQASEKCNHPLRAVVPPDEDLIALADAALLQFARKAIRVAQHIAIGPSLPAIAAVSYT